MPVIRLKDQLLAVVLVVLVIGGGGALWGAYDADTGDKETPITTTENAEWTPPDPPQHVTQTYWFRNGNVNMEFPLTVRFQRYNNSSFEPAYNRTVGVNESITVRLNTSVVYRLKITDQKYNTRMIALYKPVEQNATHQVVIGGCCVDDY